MMGSTTDVYMFSRYPTRTEAATIIRDMVDSGVLNNDIAANLLEIVTCIEYERLGVDLFGASHDITAPLFVTCRVPDETDTDDYKEKYAKHCETVKRLEERYLMCPRKDSVIRKSGVIVEVPDDCFVGKREEYA